MWKWVRVGKSVALLAFLLPWLTVSCSGQHVASPSGLDLLRGQFLLTDPVNGRSETVASSPSLLITLAILAIIAGLILTFRSRDGSGNAGPAVFGTSSGALALIFLGTVGINGSRIASAAAERGGSGFDAQFGAQMASAMIQVEYALGFWVAAIALAGSAFVAWMIWQGKGSADIGALGERLSALSGGVGIAGDTAHWDSMGDKDNPDALQEYLIRFPEGRFSQLARQKLARMSVEPLAPMSASAPPTPEPEEPIPAIRTCPQCGMRYGADVKFCAADGMTLVA